MGEAAATPWVAYLWDALGIIGSLIFYGRFYVQWIVSERQKRSVIPVAFWYMSSVGTLILFPYAVYLQSPVGALGQSLNIVIYARNLVHIWREKGTLTSRRNRIVNTAAGLLALIAVLMVIFTWMREYQGNAAVDAQEAARNWIWLMVGLVGQALFAMRFLVQWIATERRKKSVAPPLFWHFSLWASVLQAASFTQRAICIEGHRMEFVYALGALATTFIYFRNLWLIHMHPEEAKAAQGD